MQLFPLPSSYHIPEISNTLYHHIAVDSTHRTTLQICMRERGSGLLRTTRTARTNRDYWGANWNIQSLHWLVFQLLLYKDVYNTSNIISLSLILDSSLPFPLNYFLTWVLIQVNHWLALWLQDILKGISLSLPDLRIIRAYIKCLAFPPCTTTSKLQLNIKPPPLRTVRNWIEWKSDNYRIKEATSIQTGRRDGQAAWVGPTSMCVG